MTMQRADYEAIAFGIRDARDDALAEVDPALHPVIKAAFRTAAVSMARHLGYNPRFLVGAFMTNALGTNQGVQALAAFNNEKPASS